MVLLTDSTGATVPAWVAVLIAIVTGLGAILAAVWSAWKAGQRLRDELRSRAEEAERDRVARSTEFDRQLEARAEEVRLERAARSDELERQLAHDRALRVRDEYRTALDAAALVAVRFRERLAATLREASGSARIPAGTVKPLALDRDDLIELREARARLTIRFGASHDVTRAFQAFYESVQAGVKLAGTRAEHRPRAQPISDTEGQRKRATAQRALDAYLKAAQAVLEGNGRLEPRGAPETAATPAGSRDVVRVERATAP